MQLRANGVKGDEKKWLGPHVSLMNDARFLKAQCHIVIYIIRSYGTGLKSMYFDCFFNIMNTCQNKLFLQIL
jgi:hypothetical protein